MKRIDVHEVTLKTINFRKIKSEKSYFVYRKADRRYFDFNNNEIVKEENLKVIALGLFNPIHKEVNFDAIDVTSKLLPAKMKVEKCSINTRYVMKTDDSVAEYNYSFSYTECDSLISNIEKGYRFFAYKKLIGAESKEIFDRYTEMIQKPVDQSNVIGNKLLISPSSFLTMILLMRENNFANSLDIYLNTESFSEGETIYLELKKDDFFSKCDLMLDCRLPKLQEFYNFTQDEDKIVSYHTLVEFERSISFNKKIELSSDLSNYSYLDEYEFVECENIIYKIPWFFYNLKETI